MHFLRDLGMETATTEAANDLHIDNSTIDLCYFTFYLTLALLITVIILKLLS